MIDSKIETFMKIVELKSYTKAADELGLTQPAVSQHMHRLEEYYGCHFFTIEGRKVELTSEGEILYQYACQQQATEQQLLDLLNHRKLHIRMAATMSIADYYLPEILSANLHAKNIDFSVMVGNTESLLEKLLAGELDCALVEGLFDRHMFEHRVFLTENFIPVASIHHPLAGQSSITLHELFSYPLITREKGSGTRAIMENYLYMNNSSTDSFDRLWEFGSFTLIKHMLTESNGVSFMYEKVGKEDIQSGRLVKLKLKNYSLTHPFYLVYLKNNARKKEMDLFFDYLCKCN